MGWGGTDRGGYAEQPQLKAIDYKTGKIRWSIPRYGGNSGLLSTAGNVLFSVGRRRHRRLQRHHRRAAVELARSAAASPTARSPTSSTASSTSSPAPAPRLVAFVLNQ